MSTSIQNPDRRKLFCVMSARALPYAEKGIQSLFANVAESVSLTIITDGAQDKDIIANSVSKISPAQVHTWAVYSQLEAEERASIIFQKYPHIAKFREGHPCWRKITDPILFSSPGEEMIILDPDLYFPNKFRFELTPASGLQLMWQPPSCLLPDQVVMRAYAAGVKLAHHVDIGVSQLRNTLDLDWLDWFIGALGGSSLPLAMHIEAIIWAGLAMRIGGGYFDSKAWYCWQYRQWKRMALKIGVSGVTLLKRERLSSTKCFHASGVAKWFVKEACERDFFPEPLSLLTNGAIREFVELSQRQYMADQRVKRIVRRLGYYKLMRQSG